MKLIVEIRWIYGRELIYPICDKAKLLARFANVKAFNHEQIDILKNLGYEIELKEAKL